jgi:hypothetical protein
METRTINGKQYRKGKTLGQIGLDKMYEGMMLARGDDYEAFMVISLADHEGKKIATFAKYNRQGKDIGVYQCYPLNLLNKTLCHWIGEHETL